MTTIIRFWLRLVSFGVPGGERTDWYQEWAGEVDVLLQRGEQLRALMFVAGALPHAFFLRASDFSLDRLGSDVRFAARTLRRAPGFTLVAVFTLAMGIGANGVIFSLVNRLILRSPEGVETPGLIQVGKASQEDFTGGALSWPNYELLQEAEVGIEFAGSSIHQYRVGVDGTEGGYEFAYFVTGNWFELLGVRPALGRLIDRTDDEVIGGSPVVVLGHGLWLERFGGDPQVLGRTINLTGDPFEVVGVAPEGFVGRHNVGVAAQLFVPATMNPGYQGSLPFGSWRWSWLDLIGRLELGLDFDQVEPRLATLSDRLRAAHPNNEGIELVAAEGIGLPTYMAQETRRVSRVLLGMTAGVLLITCLTIANLLILKASSRRGEIGVRRAVGAGRGRLARQFLTESLLLGLLAVAVSVPLVWLAARVIPSLVPIELTGPVPVDGRVLAWLLASGIGTSILFGMAPVLTALTRIGSALPRGADTGEGRRRTWIRDGLLVVQLGVSLGLVTGAVLLGRSLYEARRADPGFESRGLTAAFVTLPSDADLDADASAELVDRLLRELGDRAGVASVAVAAEVPVAGSRSMGTVRTRENPEVAPEVELNSVGAGYFETFGIPILQGQELSDTRASEVVVNQSLARILFGDDEPLGRTIGEEGQWRVVGVSADVQSRSLRQSAGPAIYFPLRPGPGSRIAFGVSTPDDAEFGRRALEDVLSAEAANLTPTLVDIRSAVLRSVRDARDIGILTTAFAGLALLLASVGLYGLVANAVGSRRREFGVRLVLGASPEVVTRLALGRWVWIAAAGVAVGAGASLVSGRTVEGLLFGVGSADPRSFVLAAIVLGLCSLLAAWLPARRAGRMPLVEALRE